MSQARHFKFWPKNLSRHLSIPATSLFYNLEVAARRYPAKDAIVFYGTRLPYSRLLREVELMAGFLQHRCGVRKGDRVLIDMQNSPQFVIAWYAILRADAVVVPVSPMNVTDELVHYFDDSGAVTALFGQELYDRMQPLLGRQLKHAIVASYSDYLADAADPQPPEFLRAERRLLTDPGVVSWSDALAADYSPLASEASSADLAAILYTSGTTGKPKGCMHTHSTIMATTVGAALWEMMSQDSVALATAPMFHVTGLQHSVNAPIYAGATIVILPRWSPEAAALLIERYGCTHWANVPTMVVDLLAHPATEQRDLSSLQVIFGGGSSMPEAVAQQLYERCAIRYMEAYGMTETISQTHINPITDLRKQCLGIPTFDTIARVIDPDTLRTLGPNVLGEIVVHGPQVMKGYWNRPDADAQTFIEIDGLRFLRTGDLGRYDKDGFYYIADRLKRMINASGYKVWPAEVEAALYKHPDIKEVAVISAPDARRGETVKAVVVLRDEARGKLTAEALIAWARGHMAAYKVPRLVEFVDALPRSGTGKIQWRALQEAEWSRVGSS
ncbi:MAG TPA: long-chain fatty acid--CoA ligase [Burkholderiales bacterium]|jgi:fatty-acyl-CoA synthase|nr:long-chain fatty acid--CoA ligase [Burkholderiales bacterium]